MPETPGRPPVARPVALANGSGSFASEVRAVYGVVGGVVIVGGSLLLMLLAVFLVRRLVPHQTMARHNDVAGFVYATIGVTYAVVLAFVVIAVWENYAETRQVADQEASSLGALYRMANGFPDPHRAAAQEAALGLRRGRGRRGVAGDGGGRGPDPAGVGGAGPPVRGLHGARPGRRRQPPAVRRIAGSPQRGLGRPPRSGSWPATAACPTSCGWC